jgi:hypothetical protein
METERRIRMDLDTLIRLVAGVEGALQDLKKQLPVLSARVTLDLEEAAEVHLQAKEAVEECIAAAEGLDSEPDFSKVIERLRQLPLEKLIASAEWLLKDATKLVDGVRRAQEKRLEALDQLSG